MKRIFEAVSVIFSREQLEGEAPVKQRRRPSLLRWILESEPLPPPAVSVPPVRVPLWRWLLQPEPLPPADTRAAAAGIPSLFSTLIASETLPLDPEPPKKAGRPARKGRGGEGDRFSEKKR